MGSSEIQKIYLIGNPNVGKTSLFNVLTHSKEGVGNYAGTTITEKSKITEDKKYEIIDLAGMYASDSQKGEEKFAWEKIESVMGQENTTFVQVIHAGEWRKSLSLTLDLQKKGIHPVLFFNTKKSDKNLGKKFYTTLAKEFSLPVFFGDVYDSEFSGIFWKKLQISQKRLEDLNAKRSTPKVFSSRSEQEQYISRIFQKFLDTKKKVSNFLDRIFLQLY